MRFKNHLTNFKKHLFAQQQLDHHGLQRNME